MLDSDHMVMDLVEDLDADLVVVVTLLNVVVDHLNVVVGHLVVVVDCSHRVLFPPSITSVEYYSQ